MPLGDVVNVLINFHPKQWLAFISKATELLFGGSAGPGKSHLLRLAAILWCNEIPGLQVYLFRRVEDDLRKNHIEGPSGFPVLLAAAVLSGDVTIIDTEIRFNRNGSRIFLCHCKDDRHRYKYHGAEIHVLMIDELTTFTEIIFRYLRFRVRMVGIKLPEKYRKGGIGLDGKRNSHDLFPRIVCASNPGNIGHHWVKRTFGLDRASLTKPTRMDDIEGGMVRQYIAALLKDNPTMERDDPTYRARMRGLGDPALVRAMEDGDWNILAGGYFPEFRLERHVLKAITLPFETHFTRTFRAHDWGSAKPFSDGWYAICDQDWYAEGTLGNEILVPRGALVRYREWYGKKENQDNVGIKLPVEKWAAGVMRRTPASEPVPIYDVSDPSMWQEHSGPSLCERAMKVRHDGKRMQMRKADNTRIGKLGAGMGWDQVRIRLRGEDADEQGDGGTPTLFLMDNGPDGIRLMQSAQHDELKPEDIDTDQEDHALDEIRYACLSRPRPSELPQKKRRPPGPKAGTFAHMMAITDHAEKNSSYEMEE